MTSKIITEIREHAPFTLIATLIAIILTAAFVYIFQIKPPQTLFEILHPLHVFVSAIVTAAIYHKYKQNLPLALTIGILGSIIIGSFSDILLPFLGGNLLNLDMHFHLPLIEIPLIIILTAGIGSIIGIKSKITKLPHTIHVFLSVFASLFYLIAYSQAINIAHILVSTIIIFLAVLVPCCISDIVFPLWCVKNCKISSKNKN